MPNNKSSKQPKTRNSRSDARDAVGDEFRDKIPARQLYSRNLPFPTRKIVQMVYGSNFSLTTGSVDLFGAERSFRLNSIYDPDFTTTGHQPYGHDTYATMYARYLVKRCRVQATIFDPSADGIVTGVLFRNGDNGTNILQGNSINAIMEQPAAIVRHVMASGSQARQLDVDVPIHLALGLTQQEYTGNWVQTGAIFGANPNVNAYFTIAAADSDAATAKTIKVSLRLTFDVELHARLSLPQS